MASPSTTARSESFAAGPGETRWTRVGLGFGPTYAFLRGPGAVAAAFACLDVARLHVQGAGLPTTQSDSSWDLGVRGGLEVGVRRRAWTPKLGLAVGYWPRPQAAIVLGSGQTLTLPAVDLIASLGLGWGELP